MSDRPRVLVVDDESDVRTIVGLNLRLGGVDFGEAADGEEALEMLRSGLWNGCVLDLAMPHMSGLEVLERLKAEGIIDRMSVLVLAADGAPATAIEAMHRGAHTYLSKPFSPLGVARTICELLDMSPEERVVRRDEMIERADNLERLGVGTV